MHVRFGVTHNMSLRLLIILQNKIIRSVCTLKFRDHTSELFYNLNCLTLLEMISFEKFMCDAQS